MARYIRHRLLQSVILLFVVLTLVFFSLYLTGDPVALTLPANATMDEIAKMRTQLGFDKPLWFQFGVYISGLFHGDMGTSLQFNEPVLPMIMELLPNTLLLTAVSILVSLVLGIVLGLGAAVRQGGIVDFLSLTLSTLGQAIPVFWLGMLLIRLFAVKLQWLPVSGFLSPQSIILPGLTLGLYSSGRMTRIVRSEALDTMNKNYIQVARARGLPQTIILFKHVLRSASISVVTMTGLEISTLLGGAVVTETVFSWPGIGRLLVNSAIARDFPLTRACILVICSLFLLVNLVVDILYCLLDPRIRYTA